MAGAQPAPKRTSMRPPPRPNNAQTNFGIGRAQSPAESITSTAGSRPRSPSIPLNTGTKRKERDYEQDAGEETNINVVVRCRGRSDREVRENSGVVVSANGVTGKSVEFFFSSRRRHTRLQGDWSSDVCSSD